MEIGVDLVILEGDSEFLINALESGCGSLAQFGHNANDVQYHCNSVAHSLVRQVVFSLYLLVWMEDVPPDIESVLQVDLKSLPQ